MNIVCASAGLVWHESPKKGILNVRDGGFEAIMLDLSVCCSAQELENLGKERKASGVILNQKKEEAVRISEHPEQPHTSGQSALPEPEYKAEGPGRTADAACKGEYQGQRAGRL